jgi:hypothetical protein
MAGNETGWMPIGHYMQREDRKVGLEKLQRLIAVGKVKTKLDREQMILVDDSNKGLLIKKPAEIREPAPYKPLEDKGKYGWKLEETVLTQYQTTLQGVVEAAKYAGLKIETRKKEGRLQLRLTRELEHALQSYRQQARPLP